MINIEKLTTEQIIAALNLSRPPWAHQPEEWEASQSALSRLLWWEMGTGKTTAAIGFLRLKYRKYGKIGKTLILAPLATLPGWVREFKQNSPESVSSRVVIASGLGKKKMPGKKRAEILRSPDYDIFVTNFDSLNLPDVLIAIKEAKFDYLVVDEIHSFKGHDSRRLKNLLTFCDKIPCKLGLTGTLILNNYFDVWGPCRILDGGKRFGTNFYSHFRRKYFVDIGQGYMGQYPNWQPTPECADAVSLHLATLSSRKKKEECLTLPPRVIMREEVLLADEQRRLYDEMEKELIASVSNGTATASNALVRLLRMRQILSGFVPVENEEDPGEKTCVAFESPRMERLRELIEGITVDSKVVVWANFRPNYPQLRQLCNDLGVGYAELTGDTKDRQAEIDRFKSDPKCRVFLSNPQAGGTGVDGLQHAASYCIYYDRSHNLAHYLQSRDRIHRGGAEVHSKITEIHLVAASTIDQDILDALDSKENFAENVIARIKEKYGKQGNSAS